jgi:hypothetical protein
MNLFFSSRFKFPPLILIIIASLFSSVKTSAQSQLVPWLGKNGLYGLADLAGVVVIPAQYQEIKLHRDLPFISFEKNLRWGIMDQNGKVLIEPVLNTYHQLHKLTIGADDDKGYQEGDMIYVEDNGARKYFLIHSSLEKPIDLNHPKNNKGKLQLTKNFKEYGLTIVYSETGEPNIINTEGRNIFKEAVYEVEIYDAELIGLQKVENGLFALFNPLTDKQTDYIYQEIHKTQLPGKVIGQKILPNNPKPFSFLIDANFKEIILGPYDVLVCKNQERILGRHDNQAIIFDFEGNKQFEISGFNVRPFSFNSLFLLDKFNKIGLVNNSGQLVVDTIYSDIRTMGQHSVLFKRENQYGLFSKDWQEQFRIPEKIVEEFPNSKGQFKILDESTGKFGIIDSLGNYLAAAEYDWILPFAFLYSLRKQDTTFFRSLDFKTEIKATGYTLLESNGNIESILSANGKKYIFDRSGSSWTNSPTCKSEEIEESLKKTYSIKVMQDSKTRLKVYMAINENDRRSWTGKVFNECGEDLVPEGFVFPYFYYQSNSLNNGIILICTSSDLKSGAINFEGKWVIPCDYQHIQMLGNNYFLAHIGPGKGYHIYDKKGKFLFAKDYHIIQSDDDAKNLESRYKVSYFEDKEALNQLIKSSETVHAKDQFRYFYKNLQNLKMSVGFVDSMLNEVITPKFDRASKFRFEHATVLLAKNGKQKSGLIDLDGNLLLETDFEELEILDSTYILTKNGNLQGLMDYFGNEIFSCKFKKVVVYKDWSFAIDGIETLYYNTKRRKGGIIGLGGSNVEIQKYFDPYVRVKVSEGSKHNVFFLNNYDDRVIDTKMLFESPWTEIDYHLDALPVDIIKVRNKIPFYYNLRTGMEYREQ